MLCLNVCNTYVYNYVGTLYVQMNYTSTRQVFIHSSRSSTHYLENTVVLLCHILLISEPLISVCTPVSRTTMLVSRVGINVYEAVSKSSMLGLSTAIETKV